MAKTKLPQPAGAGAFRELTAEPVLLELPESGLAVAVRRVHIMELAHEGVLPSQLTGLVMEALGYKRERSGNPELKDAVDETVALIDAVCCAALVEPRMVAGTEDPDAIRPTDMPYLDREHIYNYVCRAAGVEPLERFRDEPARRLATVANGAGGRGAAE